PDSVPGTVVLLGTPAEEGHSGKEVMARAGAFDGLDAAIMVHGYGYDCADQVWLGRRLLRVTFSGIAAHASAQPFMAATPWTRPISSIRDSACCGSRCRRSRACMP